MKVGFQTIVWWPFREPLEYRLKVIAAAGYQGVEFMERPYELPPVEKLLKLLKQYDLELIGLAGGSIKSRMEYCRDFRSAYLYTDDWNDEIARLVEKSKTSKGGEFTLAVHPHVFKPTRSLKTIQKLLSWNPNLKFVPDTAHITIIGDDSVKAIRLWKDRIAAIHLKDWSPEFGRSAHSYARGFAEPGGGVVNLEDVLKTLRDINYSGWLIAEQDSAKTCPETNTFEWARWLARKGLLSEPKSMPMRRLSEQEQKTVRKPAEAHFLDTVMLAGRQDIESCYESVAKAVLELTNCKLVTLWTCSPAYRLMNLVAVTPDVNISLPHVIYYHNTASGDTIAEQTIQHFDLNDPAIVKRFAWREILKEKKFRWMVSVPVFNPWNPHHVRLVINIFHNEDKLCINDGEVFRASVAISHSTTSALSEICTRSAARVNLCAGRSKYTKDFAERLAALVEKGLDCKKVDILLKNPYRKDFVLVAHRGEEHSSDTVEALREQWQNSTDVIWDTKETLMMPMHGKKVNEKGQEIHPEAAAACMIASFLGTDGTNLGSIRCCNKITPRKFGILESFAFCDDDAAILDAIACAAAPYLELLTAQERRQKALGRLTHELKVPLVAIRGAAEFMMRIPEVKRVFDYDYPGDIWSWSELMGRLIDNADALRYSDEGMQIKPSRTHILPGVIAPAIKQARLLLEERGFSKNHITYRGVERFPVLWLDRNRFQQVMFNLLSNAIKYAYNDPDYFRVEIEGIEQGAKFMILFRDWGPGIEEGMEEAIFLEEVRSKMAVEMDVTGQGLGLWIVRQIVNRHGGRIELRNSYNPTEFEIHLPYSLTSRPPS